MSNGRIPDKNADFHSYVVDGNTYLKKTVPGGSTTRGEYLGMTSVEMTALDGFSTDVDAKYTANRNKSTKDADTAAAYRKVKANFGKFFRPILDRIAANPLIETDDYKQLNIAEPVTSHSAPPPITEKCNCLVNQLGGGTIEGACRSTVDQSRPSVPENADGVQITWFASEQPGMSDGQIETQGVPKYMEIKQPSQCPSKEFFSGATFELKLGPLYSGMRIQYYVRWYNSKHPENAGPWLGPTSMNIW